MVMISRRTALQSSAFAFVGIPTTAPSSTSPTPPKPAEVPDVILEAGRGVAVLEDSFWYVHGGKFEFAVTLGSRTQARSRTARLVVPNGFDVLSISGTKWEVDKVDSTTIEATHPELSNPGWTLPKLVIKGKSSTRGISNLSAAVHDQSSDYKRKSVKVRIDTSV